MNTERIFDEFPAPSYRGNQEGALQRIADAFDAGNEVVLVRAPTGSGKSLLARAICGCARTVEEADPAEATDAYYTTPQVSQLDDVATEPLLSDLQIIRGKRNYDCILPGETETPVNRAPCVRQRGFDCTIRHRCPYFSDRAIASNRRIAAMTLAYFMQTAGSDVFGSRDVVVIDEAHGLAEWAEMYATIELSPRTLPVWDRLRVPVVEGSVERTARFAKGVIHACKRRKDELLAKAELTASEAAERDRLAERIGELEWFGREFRDPRSPTTWVVDQADAEASSGTPGGSTSQRGSGSPDDDEPTGGPLTIKPMNPERFLAHTVWDRGNRFALLSATILDKESFCRSVGLDPATVALVDVGHTFPVENRPLYDVTQGKMTYDHRDETLPKVARTLVRIMQRHPDEKGIVHCHSYAIQERLWELCADFGVGARVLAHDRDGRDAALESWKARDDASVFLAVKMEEALDLEGDLARWQVLCKAPYLNTRDSRVAYRLEEGRWPWYHRAALRTVIQACGRVVRAPDDYGATYLVDSSLLDLFDRTRGDLPPWFAAQVDRMERPELPAFDPRAAVGTADGDAPGSGDRTPADDADSRPAESRSARTSTPARTGSAAGRSSGDRSGDGSTVGTDRSGRRHPLADVWDTD